MKTVIVNRMFTGKYLSEGKNIGHETFMLFRPDKKNGEKQPYQIYLMSNGDYPVSRIDDIPKAILLVRGIDSKTLEVTAKATGIKQVFKPKGNWVGYFDAPETRCLGREMLKREMCEKWWNQLTERKKKNIQKKIKLDEIGVKEIFSTYIDSLSFQKNKVNIENNIGKWEKIVELLYLLADLIAVNDLKEKNIEGGCDLKLSKAVRFRAVHIEQLCYIIKKDIRFAGVRMDEYYKNNSESMDGTSIFVTYTAEKLVKAKTKIILSIDESAEGEGIYKIESRDRLSGSSSATYFEYKDLESILADNNWGDEFKEVDKAEIKNISENTTFLSIVGKEYDELAYSNMFSYFLKNDKSFLSYFLNKLFNVKLNVADKCTLTVNTVGSDVDNGIVDPSVAREHKNIDLLIEIGKNVFVIENKIKSAINGAEHDIHGKTIKNQLDKYYKYIEEKYDASYSKFYALFIPNYNKTICPTDASEPQKLFFSNIIYYKKITEVCENYFNEVYLNKPLTKEKVYFEDFVKSLKKHSKDSDNDFENVSLLRMKDFICF